MTLSARLNTVVLPASSRSSPTRGSHVTDGPPLTPYPAVLSDGARVGCECSISPRSCHRVRVIPERQGKSPLRGVTYLNTTCPQGWHAYKPSGILQKHRRPGR